MYWSEHPAANDRPDECRRRDKPITTSKRPDLVDAGLKLYLGRDASIVSSRT
jgi:hypothetical protein